MKQRVIKFRAWDKTENAMVGGGKGDTLDFIADFDGYRSPDGISNNDFIWEQFTGLLDKNGKEIYEGDILKGVLNEKEQIVKVVFNEGSFDIQNRSIEGFCLIEIVGHGCEGGSCEVIGNIHENPELLTT